MLKGSFNVISQLRYYMYVKNKSKCFSNVSNCIKRKIELMQFTKKKNKKLNLINSYESFYQGLVPLGTAISWLFAFSEDGATNGFSLTG